jgi:hypothetical protein
LLRNMANGFAAPAKKPPANPDNLTVNSAGRVEELIGECVCSPAKVYPHKERRCRGVAIRRRIREEQRRKQQTDQVPYSTVTYTLTCWSFFLLESHVSNQLFVTACIE